MEADQEEDGFDLNDLSNLSTVTNNANSVFTRVSKTDSNKNLPDLLLKKAPSLANITPVDVRKLILDPAQIEQIKNDVKEFKTFIEQRAKVVKVKSKVEHRNSESEKPSSHRDSFKEQMADLKEPLIGKPATAILVPRVSKMQSTMKML
jgi:hypothetical protein